MDPIEMLIDGAVQHEVIQNKNPYLTMETIILRLYKKIAEYTQVEFYQMDKTVLFSEWHDEILNVYKTIKSKMSHDERTGVERVLSKDCPHPNELAKFALVWHKYDPFNVCRWFAVDGIIGTHPKLYVHDAFSNTFYKHNSAVRRLYSYHSSPEIIKLIVGKALDIKTEETDEPDIDQFAGLYAEMVGEEEMERVAADRRAKLHAQQTPSKRKKKIQPVSPELPQPSDSA